VRIGILLEPESPTNKKPWGFFRFVRPRLVVTKKRLLLIATLPLIIAVTLGVFAMVPSGPGVSKANFDRIQEGMTMAEVEEIFGGKGATAGMHEHTFVFWIANDGSSATVDFVNDCVGAKRWHDSDETILNKIRRWLHFP
jgi:hypothetical protein